MYRLSWLFCLLFVLLVPNAEASESTALTVQQSVTKFQSQDYTIGLLDQSTSGRANVVHVDKEFVSCHHDQGQNEIFRISKHLCYPLGFLLSWLGICSLWERRQLVETTGSASSCISCCTWSRQQTVAPDDIFPTLKLHLRYKNTYINYSKLLREYDFTSSAITTRMTMAFPITHPLAGDTKIGVAANE